MKVVALTRYLPVSDPDALVDLDMDKPEPNGRDILVAVKAVSVNPVDAKVRAPKDMVESKPKVLGWDASGIVEAVGPDVTLFRPGDEVYYAGDITRQGSNAEFQLVDERIVGHKPASLSFAEAAALPLTTLTAYEAFFHRLRIDKNGADKGKTLLIVGAAGGVGSIGIQLAKAAGLNVIATASRPETTAWVQELGADHVVNHRQPLADQVRALDMRFVDYIAVFNDSVDWDALTDLVAPQGAIVTIVGAKSLSNMDRLGQKAASLHFELMFTRAMFQTSDMIEQHRLLDHVAGEIDAGRLRTTLETVLRPINAKNILAAHEMLESGRAKGKIVVEGF